MPCECVASIARSIALTIGTNTEGCGDKEAVGEVGNGCEGGGEVTVVGTTVKNGLWFVADENGLR